MKLVQKLTLALALGTTAILIANGYLRVKREVAVLQALALGQSNKEIARSLWLAEQTVKFHLTNIYRKLGVSNRTEAARLAYQHGLVESPIGDH